MEQGRIQESEGGGGEIANLLKSLPCIDDARQQFKHTKCGGGGGGGGGGSTAVCCVNVHVVWCM